MKSELDADGFAQYKSLAGFISTTEEIGITNRFMHFDNSFKLINLTGAYKKYKDLTVKKMYHDDDVNKIICVNGNFCL